MSGHFVVSLDFELHWGVFDQRTVESYKENLSNVPVVIHRLLEMADKYDVKLTFATVGFLFAKDKQDLLNHLPEQKPTFVHQRYSPYPLIDSIGNDEKDDPYHYAHSLIKKIRDNGNHEIGTHTFCHYYCHELGQTVEQFEDDLKSAIAIAKQMDIKLESIIFPRNMMDLRYEQDLPYAETFYKLGFKSFRGKEKAYIYNIFTQKFYHGWYIFKILRMMDAYSNVTGMNTYNMDELYVKNKPLNIPSSRLLRAYNKTMSFLEPLKVHRITSGMRHAAQKNELFHLWWHPHNFGTHMDENFKNLEAIFKEYSILNKTKGFQSETMTSLTNQIISRHENI
ncbi:MAG: polysaccharide deacetylase family protein [Gelidibacter sp.]